MTSSNADAVDHRWPTIEHALRQFVGAGTSIYLMYQSPSLVKIGQSDDAEGRRIRLQRELGSGIILMGCCTASPKLELALHHVFHETRVLGTEWFAHEPLLDRLARTLNAIRSATTGSTFAPQGWWPTLEDTALATSIHPK
jgi:hypothetical protein